jgi:hypothetical protein
MDEDISAIHRQFRREGIFPNHRAVQPTSKCRLPPLPPITDIREPFLFSPTSHLSELPEHTLSPSERLTLSSEVASFLQLITRFPSAAIDYPEDESPAASASVGRAYLEEPLTTGDFSKPVRNREVKPVADDPGLHWSFKDKGDDTLKWGISVRKEIAAWEKTTSHEKLEVEPSVLSFLKSVRGLPQAGEKEEESFVPKVSFPPIGL